MVLLISDVWLAGGTAGPAGPLATARWQHYALADRCGPIHSASCFESQQRPSESITSKCGTAVHGTVPPRLASAFDGGMAAEHLQWGAQQRLAGFTVSFTILLVCRIANRLARVDSPY